MPGRFSSSSQLLVAGRRAGRWSIIIALDRMIHGLMTGLMIARSAAAMAPPPPVQRKAICRPIIAVRPILPVRLIATLAALVVTLVALTVLRRLRRLTAGNE